MTARPAALAALAAVLVAAGAYSLYWFSVADGVPAAVAEWAETQRGRGYTVSYGPVEVTGFPLAFVVTVDAPVLGQEAAPAPWRWQGGVLESRVGPFRFHSVPYRVRGGSTLTYSSPRLEKPLIATAAATAGRLTLDAAGEPDYGDVVFGDVIVLLPDGERRAAAERIRLESRHHPAADRASRDGSVDLAWRIEGLELPADRAGPLGPRIARLAGETELSRISADLAGLDGQRRTVAAWRDGGGKLLLRGLTLDWGPLLLFAEGALSLDREMRPLGDIRTRVQGYREVLQALVKSGLVKLEDASKAAIVLDLLSKTPADGGRPVLELPLSARDGTLFLGPFQLGTLPAVEFPS